MRFLDTYISFILKRHRILPVVITAISLLFCYHLKDAKFASGFEGWIRKDNPARLEYREFIKRFRAFEINVLAVETDGGVFTPEALRTIEELSVKIPQRADHVRKLVSLTTASVLEKKGVGVEFKKLIGSLPGNSIEAKELEKRVKDNPIIANNFLSKDGKTALIGILIGGDGPDYSFIGENIRSIRQVMSEVEKPGIRCHFSGGIVLSQEMNRLTRRQIFIFAPIVALLVVLLLLLMLRSAWDVFLVLVCMVFSAVWTMGLYVWTGHLINFLAVAMPPLVMVINVSDSVHMIMRFREERAVGVSSARAVEAMIRGTVRPCLFTALATAAGFGALYWSGIPMISDFGVYTALGVLVSFAVTLCMAPSMLLIGNRVEKGGAVSTGGLSGKDFLDRLFDKIENIVSARPKIVLAVGAVIFLASIHGITKIVVDTNNLDFFKKNNQVRRDTAFIESKLAGLSSLEIMYEAAPGLRMTDPQRLRVLLDLEKFLLKQPEITNAVSIADFVQEMYRVYTGRPGELPDSGDFIWQMIMKSGFRALEENRVYIRDHGQFARVSARVRYSSTNELEDMMKRIHNYLEEHKSPEYKVMVTGGAPVYLAIADSVTKGQVRSFIIEMIIVSCMMAMLFRSFRWGVLAMIPNVAPIAFELGVMGWAGIPLNVATMMIASITIGIAVDDTMHLMARCRQELEKGVSYDEAVKISMRVTGRAMTATAFVLAGGFGVLSFSSFVPLMQFGYLSAMTIIVAIIAEWFLTPALLIVFRPKL